MAGTAILKKQTTKTALNSGSSNSLATAGLNTTLHTKPANIICCCLWLQQPSQTMKANSNNITSMQQQTTTKHCCRLNSSCMVDDKISTKTSMQQQQHHHHQKKMKHQHKQQQQQRPLTLSLAVILMSLTILLIQMPTMVQSKSSYDESSLSDYTIENEFSVPNSIELETKLISLLTKKLHREEEIAEESSSDELTSLDVIKHIQRNEEHQKTRGRRLHKRHLNDLIISRYLDESAENLEWSNTCGGHHLGGPNEMPHSRRDMYLHYRKFENIVGIQHDFLKYNTDKIPLNDMADWNVHQDTYKFLPKVPENGTITLYRWHREMQREVGSIASVARLQYSYDMEKRQYAGEISLELNQLLQSARLVLCELETTINNSAPINNPKKLHIISRKAMNARLNFVTKNVQHNGAVVEPFLQDLKFAKYNYLQYLAGVQRTLKQRNDATNKKYGFEDDSEDNSNNSNTIVGDANSSFDTSMNFNSDSSDSAFESFEQHFKSTKRPQTQRRRNHKRKTTKLPKV